MVKGVAAEDLVEALARVGHGGRSDEGLRGGVELKVLAGMRESVVGDERGHVAELGLLRTHELAAGGSVEEEVADSDRGALRQAGVFDAEEIAAGDFKRGADLIFRGAGFETEAGDGGNGRQGFTAEAERDDGKEIVRAAELGGGMTLEGQQGVIAAHAVAVIDDADELAASGFDLDANARGACVERVFEKLLDDGGRALDDLSGGNLIRNLVRKNANPAHKDHCTRARAPVGWAAWALVLGSAALEDGQFLAGVESSTLPKACFRHADHLRLAWLRLRSLPVEEAVVKVKRDIFAYATTLGAAHIFHHTVTEAWVRLLATHHEASFVEFLSVNEERLRTPVVAPLLDAGDAGQR